MRSIVLSAWCVIIWSLPMLAQQDTMNFYSKKEFNEYRFSKSDLQVATTGFFLDMEEEFTAGKIDTMIMLLNRDYVHVDAMLSLLTLMENTDVTYSFDKDSLLFPIMDHFMAVVEGKVCRLPLLIADVNFSRLLPNYRDVIDTWYGQQAYPTFTSSDMSTVRLQTLSLFSDSLFHDKVSIYWDASTFISNTGANVSNVKIFVGNEWVELNEGVDFDISSFILGGLDRLAIDVLFSDGTTMKKECFITFGFNVKPKSGPNFDFEMYEDHWDNLSLQATVYLGCGDDILNKPFILVAGWGPFTDKPKINSKMGWPSSAGELYNSWNQANFIQNLREVGYDVIICRFIPPNADIRKNTVVLERMINRINELKFQNGSFEENVILGYSAGAMAVRLTLQTMEHRHLNFDGPHPHTKLYVSFDGEHGGANIPLSTQHTVRFMNKHLYPILHYEPHTAAWFQSGFKIYTLNYILNAPLSKQLLKYFHTETGTYNNPGQGEHPLRTEYMWEYSYHNHAKNTHLPNYPSFSRNISISNGMSDSRITGYNSEHAPFPPSEGFTPYSQTAFRRHLNSSFNRSGGNVVFQYKWRTLLNGWQVKMEAGTNWNCLVLDNAPGGTVFIPENQNPLVNVLNTLRRSMHFITHQANPNIFRPQTQFCFTPILLTHDIRNFDPSSTGYRMDYSMKENLLMFKSLQSYNNFINNEESLSELASNFWGYPHLAYPETHYWEVTPFDAVFSGTINSEHILFNKAYRSNPLNYSSPWIRIFSDVSDTVKNFIMDEADYYGAFIQNKRYGWNARDNYTYKAAIKVPSVIKVGEHVTDRTNFRPAEFLSNSDITLEAQDEIHIKEGTIIYPGAVFHAKIAPYDCYFNKSVLVEQGDQGNGGESNHHFVTQTKIQDEVKDNPFVVYPNPSTGVVNIKKLNKDLLAFNYFIYDIGGQELAKGSSEDMVTTFKVNAGIYLLKLTHHEKSYTFKVIVH